ncbi:MAG: zf-HC2 domain-containing protein [Polyangiales bacterium]
MDCETCNDLLMDLLYDELDEVRAAAARKHLDGCASCRGAWQRLSQGRALASTLAPVTAPLPSATLLAAVETAARQNAERTSETPSVSRGDEAARASGGGEPAVAPVIPLEHAPRRVPTWLHRLGDLAMRREFAMAAVLLMAVGVTMRFLPWHTPGSVDNVEPGTAPQVIPAQELPAVPVPAAAPEASATPTPRSRVMRSANAMRPLRAEPREQTAEGRARGGTPVRVEESDSVASNAIAQHATTRIAQPSSAAGPLGEARYGSAPPPAIDHFNAPSAVASADRDLGRVLPAAPQPAVPAWRAAFNAGEDHRANHNRAAAIASYRAALESAPDDERARIATALIGQLSQDGRVAEVEVVRARYLRPTPNAAAQVDEAQGQAPSTPHVPSSVPHPSTQRPARRAMPSATNIQAY